MNDYLHLPSDDELRDSGDDGRPDEAFPLYPPGAFGDGTEAAEDQRAADGGERQLVSQIIGPASPVYNMLADAAQRFGLHLPCLPEEVEIAFPKRMWCLHEQAKRDACAEESLDALRRQAKEDRALLMQVGNDPALQPPASAGIQPFLVPLGAVAFIVGCLLIAWFVQHSNSTAPAQSSAPVVATFTQSDDAETASAGSTAKLWVRCYPWAECYLDGQRVSDAPSPKPIDTTPGKHTVMLRRRDGRSLECSIVLVDGSSNVLIADLNSGQISIEPKTR